jgi:CsoR family transcriptional regulator, copper-sensing transcriptional repressor
LGALGAKTGTHPTQTTPSSSRAQPIARSPHLAVHSTKPTARSPQPAASCACGAHDGDDRKATHVDPEIKDRNLKRLRRIEGQVRGLQKMVEEERYCADVLTQLSSVHEALRGVAREVMRNHLKHCAATAIRSDDRDVQEEMYDELLELMYTHAR